MDHHGTISPLIRKNYLQQLKRWQQKPKMKPLFCIISNVMSLHNISVTVTIFHLGNLIEHVQSDTLFLEKPTLLKQVIIMASGGRTTITSVLKIFVETRSRGKLKSTSIFAKVLPILNARRVNYE